VKLKFEDLAFRAWYYFRLGYGTYLGFIVGFITFVASTYYLAIKSLPFLQNIFSNFYVFILFSLAVIVPLSVLVGWLHMKRTIAYPTDVAIGVEANPYNYILTPGKETEVFVPYWLIHMTSLQKIMEKAKLLTPEEKRQFEDVRAKLQILMKGGVVGQPKQRKIS